MPPSTDSADQEIQDILTMSNEQQSELIARLEEHCRATNDASSDPNLVRQAQEEILKFRAMPQPYGICILILTRPKREYSIRFHAIAGILFS